MPEDRGDAPAAPGGQVLRDAIPRQGMIILPWPVALPCIVILPREQGAEPQMRKQCRVPVWRGALLPLSVHTLLAHVPGSAFCT